VYETAITYQTALDLFSATEGVQAPEFYLYQTVSWYGLPLTVTGIIDEKQSNSNLSLNMTGYAGSTREASSLNSGSLYVYPGFHKHHSMQEQQAFVPSHKRFIDTLTLRSYEVGNIYPIPYANAYYFYDGKQLHLDNDGNNESMVKEDEVLLDFSMALKLGYQSRYIQGFRDGGVSWDMREADYCSFIKNWIGKTIQVQAYAIDTAPDDSTLMKKTVTIKGFLFPITWEFDENYVKSEGSILMNKHAVADSMQPNSMIQSVYFHTEKEADMRGALQYLRQHPTYSAFFSRSRLLQFFVVDLKKMSFLLFMSGGCAMLLSITLLIHLLNLIMEDGKKEMSIYYMFGENMYTEGMLCAAYPCPGSQAYSRRLPDGNAGSIRVRPDDLYEAVGSGHDFAVTVSSAACVRRLSAPAYSITHQLVKRTCTLKSCFVMRKTEIYDKICWNK
ncbi:MAG: hypothetical protein ACLRL6_20825, partial [Clostridium sp.]